MPAFLRAMQTPSKACTRSRSPSTTFTLTFTVSPGRKSGSFAVSFSLATCAASIFVRVVISVFLSSRTLVSETLGPLFLINGPKIGPPQFRRRFGLGVTPGLDLLVVAGEQHLRHLQALPLRRPRVMRVLQEARLETLLLQRLLGAHDTGQEANAGIDHRQSRRFAARKDDVAEADLEQPAGLDHPLIEPLVAAADQNHSRPRGPVPDQRLLDPLAARREVDGRAQ